MYQTLIRPAFIDAKNFILDTLFPITCLSCGEEGSFICLDCKATAKKLESQRCIVCQRQAPFGLSHPNCQTPHGADGLVSFYDYHDEKVSKILIAGKYSFIPSAYEILGKAIAEQIKKHHEHLLAIPYTLSPVPLHSSRKRWRGFNQAEILCQALSVELNLEMADVLVRQKITQIQKDLKKEQRLKNVSDAFKLKKDVNISGQNFILVDDVTTTGATLQEAVKVLKRNGAAKVICLTVARD